MMVTVVKSEASEADSRILVSEAIKATNQKQNSTPYFITSLSPSKVK